MERWRPYAAMLDRPWTRWSWALPGAPNRRVVRVFALRRSGHHAILNWIRYQMPGRHCLLNECVWGANPFATCSRGTSLVRGWAGEHRSLDWDQELRGRHAKKGTLIYNYEDSDFRDPSVAVRDDEETTWLGRSSARTDVLILRDPFNLFASKLKWAQGTNLTPSMEDVVGLRDLWKAYAHEFLGDTAYLAGRVTISYNLWFLSRLYRDDRARALGFVNADAGLDEVAKWGPTTWGDSFDGLKYDGRARQMKVLERWREYAGDSVFRQALDDEELVALSKTIFSDALDPAAWRQSGFSRPDMGLPDTEGGCE